jgi:arylsulfatase A-like enzyme
MENQGYDPAGLRLPADMLDTPKTRRALCQYYTEVSWMDRQVGEVVASVSRHGMSDNTLFVYTSDHGAQWPFAKWNLYDAGINVPMIVRWPGVVRAGSRNQTMITAVDLLPTIIEAAGAARPADFDGKSFVGCLRDNTKSHREEIYAAHTGDGKMNRSPMRCVRTQRYKYISNLVPDAPFRTHISEGDDADGLDYWRTWMALAEKDQHAKWLVDRYRQRPAEELYDVTADSFEQTNLGGDRGHAEILNSMREKLRNWRVQQGEDLAKAPMPEDARRGELRYAG